MADCPICETKADCIQSELYDDRYAFPGLFDIYICHGCSHAFLFVTEKTVTGSNLYTDFYPRSTFDPESLTPKTFPGGLVSWLNGDDSAACRSVPGNVRVLDVGCGFCETLAYHRAMGCHVRGVEADKNVRAVAERHQLDVDIGPFDPDLYDPESFDFVTMHQVIEHFDDPLHALRGVVRVLRPGGRAVITTPNAHGWGAKTFGRRWINWHVPYHRHFFSEEAMTHAAEEAGMTVESARTVTSSDWVRYQWVHLLTFPAEGEPSAFWSPHGKRSLMVKVAQRLFDVLHYTKVNHLVTRLFDSLGVGDNYLFLLKKP